MSEDSWFRLQTETCLCDETKEENARAKISQSDPFLLRDASARPQRSKFAHVRLRRAFFEYFKEGIHCKTYIGSTEKYPDGESKRKRLWSTFWKTDALDVKVL